MRNKKNNIYAQQINSIKISLSSPEDVLAKSSGEVTKPETINYRTYKPESGGLFCERVFGFICSFYCWIRFLGWSSVGVKNAFGTFS